MTDKKTLIKQTETAFDFLQQLYLETSYLIREIEGLLNEEEERFVIGKPGGYAIRTRGSTGLEPNLVNLWLIRKFGVFFAPETRTRNQGGVSITKVDNSLKIFYIRVVLNDNNGGEPKVYSGVLYDIHFKSQDLKKFENVMGHIEYREQKVFADKTTIDYEDTYLKLKGELIENNLFGINNSEDIVNLIIKPSLKLYRKY